VSGAGRAREVAVATVLTAAGLGAAIAWFALRFDTFVPQNTGLSRFAQWAPLICILFLAAGAEAAIARRPVRTDRVNGRTAVMATSALILGTTGAAFVISQSFPPRLGISDEAEHAIAALNRQATPGQILVANVSTRGMLEFLTPVEVPSEARQPVIEAPTVLSAANGHLAELIRYFGGTADINAHRDFGATWVLVTDRPADFAASRTFGPRPAALPDRADLRLVWGGAHVRLYRHHAAGPVEKLGPAHGHLPRTLLAGLFLLVMGCVACAVSGVIRHPRSRVKN
ncbi:MAG: hypothetical protein ABIR57_01980, partial [Aeromicrobium sp.]